MARAGATSIKTTCPRDCYDACGITIQFRDGKAPNIVGDKDHAVSRGALCAKCSLAYNGVFIDPAKRLTTPLRRVGRKGEAAFEPCSWDEALGAIAGKLKAITAQHDPRTIIHTHYTGTCSMIAGWFPCRFFNRLGATEVDPDTVCNKAGHVALADMFGTSLDGFDPESAAQASSIFVWGANPSHSAPHMHSQWLAPHWAKTVVIDPIAHDTAKSAALHLKLRPGSDAALAFGILHVLKWMGKLDRDFLDRHTLGHELLEKQIDAFTVADAQAATGVPAALIEQAAALYASGPSLLWLGQGMQRQPKGGNAFRAAALLPVMTGYLGKPGAGFCYMNGPETRGVDGGFLSGGELRCDGGSMVSHVNLAAHLADPAQATALFTWNNNIVASSPNQTGIRNALMRDDLFTVVTDLFLTDTAAYADYVLPAASFLEFDDLVFPYFHHTVSAQAAALDPPGEALSNQDIFRRLAAAMGFNEPQLFETDASMIETMLRQTSFKGSFDDLKAVGTAELFVAPRVQFADLTFKTPSGRIEIASDRFAAQGLPRIPTPHADPMPENGRIRVLSPASLWLLNSSYGNDDRIQRRLGDPAMHINPREATRRGIGEGQSVTLSNETGSLSLRATCTEDVPEGVALVHKGRWLDGAGSANVNVLNHGMKTDMGESSAVHGVEADLMAR